MTLSANAANGSERNKGQPFIVLERITKSFHDGKNRHLIFENLDVSFNRGEFTILLGRSGSGKSTLLNLLGGIDVPGHGDICIDGLNLTRLDEKQRTLFRRRRIGFIFQSYNLIPTLSVHDNLMLPLELNGVERKLRHRRITALLADLGLEEKTDEFPDRLSGGEQQRVAIGRALVHDPDLVLADEPTGNLDLETGLSVMDMLESAVRTSETTLIMATHSLEISGRANHIYAIRNHRLEPG